MLHYLILAVHRGSEAATPTLPGDKGLSFSWAIVGFLIAIGLAITLSPARRTYEVKKPKED
jgi:hypothetical protein